MKVGSGATFELLGPRNIYQPWENRAKVERLCGNKAAAKYSQLPPRH